MRPWLKASLIGVCFLLFPARHWSQNHVQWSAIYDASTHEISIRGAIDPQWHLYSPKTDGSLGPIPLTVTLEKNRALKEVGNLEFLTEPQAYQDDNFGGTVYIWENEVRLVQKIKLKKKISAIQVTLNYMICNEMQCLPPMDVVLSIPVNP